MIIYIHLLHNDHLYKLDIDPYQTLAVSLNAAFKALYPNHSMVLNGHSYLMDALTHQRVNIYQSPLDMAMPQYCRLILF